MLIWLDAFCAKYPHIIEAFGALAPFFGTVFLAYIAYQQWQTNERQRRKELFEMRYEHFYVYFQDILSALKESIQNNNIEQIKVFRSFKKEWWKKLCKYHFLFKSNATLIYMESFANCLEKIATNIKIFDSKNAEKELIKLKDMQDSFFEPYLRIEPEYTIWDITKNFIIGAYDFLTPKWLQNFLSEQVKTSVILNWFQNLTKKEQKPTGEAS